MFIFNSKNRIQNLLIRPTLQNTDPQNHRAPARCSRVCARHQKMECLALRINASVFTEIVVNYEI